MFATRAPHRPNSIGLSCIRIAGVEEDKGIVHLLGVDLLDGTAVLDIKPCTSVPSIGYVLYMLSVALKLSNIVHCLFGWHCYAFLSFLISV